MQKKHCRIFSYLFTVFSLMAAIQFPAAAPAAELPLITSFSPQSGTTGSVVMINGFSFDPTASNNIVYFGPVRAAVTAASSTSLTVTVPAGANYAPITVTVNGLTAYSSTVFSPTFLGAGIIGSGSFAPQVAFNVPSIQAGVTVADIDGDGKPDLITADYGNGSITILRNLSTNGVIGTNSLDAPVTFSAGSTPAQVAVGDLDGDGELDLVVVNQGSGTVSVLRNTSTSGNISLAPKFDLATASDCRSVLVRDLDGDGKPEIVIASYGSSVVSIYRNLSTPGSLSVASFASRMDFATASGAVTVVVGDLNGDGKPDLITGNFPTSISVLRNTSTPGSIGFASHTDTLIDVWAVAVGDLDEDGKADVVVVNTDNNTLTALRNTTVTTTSITFATNVVFATGNYPYWVALGDLNGDGKPDVATSDINGNTVSVFQNTSTPGSFNTNSLAARVPFGTGGGPREFVLADMNGDGRLDIVTANLGNSYVSILQNVLPFGTPPAITQQPTNQTTFTGGNATFTVTASGTAPLSYQWIFNTTNIAGATNATLTLTNVQLSQAGSYAVLITNAINSILSSNALLTVVSVPVITSFSPQAGTTGTVVNITGLNFSSVPSDNVVYFGAVKAAVLAASATNMTVTVPVGATYAPITETVNGLTAYANQPFTPAFPGDGSGISTSSFAPRLDLPAGNNAFRAVIVDLDGDAKPDLVVGNVFGSSISLYRNISTNGLLTVASFAPRVDLATPTGALNPWDIAVADVDGDGKLDIIAVDSGANLISVYRNTCTPGNISSNLFATRVDFPSGPQPQGLAVRDLDGDGRPDLLVANTGDGTVSILQNTGVTGSLTTNSFAPKIDIATGGICTGVAVGDVDGDGKPDVVTVNNGSATLSLLRNIGSPGHITLSSFAPKVDFPLLGTSVMVVIGDLDSDGKPDLTISSASSGQAVSVYRNVSTPGSFSLATRVDFAAGGWANGVAIGDLDGDSKLDVALITQAPNHFSIFRNLSTPGSFTNSSLAARVDLASGSNPNGIAIGDLDGDGRPEVIFCNQYSSTLSIYQNQVPFGLPPQFTLQPTNTTVALGTTVTFTAAATGSLPLSYQWSFNTTNISGATNTSLTLTNVQFSQAGNYAVLVSNRFNSILSSNAFLTVNDKLDHFTWSQIPSPRFVNVPFNVVIKALNATNGTFTNFTGTVLLSSTNGIPINPPVSAAFVQGTWTGYITISQLATSLVMRADDGSGESGLANSIDVVNQPTLGFAPSGNSLLIFWPVASSNFVLETSFSLTPAEWIPTDPPLQIGNQYLESLQMNNSNQFFRLRLTTP